MNVHITPSGHDDIVAWIECNLYSIKKLADIAARFDVPAEHHRSHTGRAHEHAVSEPRCDACRR